MAGGAIRDAGRRGSRPLSRSVTRTISRETDRFLTSIASCRCFRLHLVKVKLTDICNLKCQMCNHWRCQAKKTVLTHRVMLSLVSDFVAMGTSWVQWSGGEPTIRDDLPELIARYRESGIHSRLSTNGTLLTKRYVVRLADAGLSAAVVSLHSADERIHDHIVGMVGAWQATVQGIRRLRAFGKSVEVCLHPLATKANCGPGLVALVKLASELNVHAIDFQAAYCGHLSDEDKQAVLPTKQQTEEYRDVYVPAILRQANDRRVSVSIEGSVQTRKRLWLAPQSVGRQVPCCAKAVSLLAATG